MQGSKRGAAKVIFYCRNGEKKHGDIHYTFNRLTKLKKESLSYRFIRCYFLFVPWNSYYAFSPDFLIINDKITTKCNKIFIESTSYAHKLCIFSKVRTVCGQIG